MRHLDTATMIGQARKAGLRTTEFYPSLARCPQDQWRTGREGRAVDANGFVADYSPQGQPFYHSAPARWPGR